MISFSCPCGQKFKIKPEHAGKWTKCPACKQPLLVPSVEATQAFVPKGEIDGSASSLDQTGIQSDVTLAPRGTQLPAGQPSVQELLARRGKKGHRYVLGGEIARGGMGAVLRAVDCDIRREVAVKFLLNQADQKSKARFVEEAQITGQLEHPNIPPVHEVGIDGQKRLFIAMKMVKGRSLAQVLDELRKTPRAAEKEWPLTRLLNVIVNICNALAYAHSRGVVHRDLKPANVMVGDFGEVYVMDWGLAKVLASGGCKPPGEAPSAGPQPGGSHPPLASSHQSKVVVSREPDIDMTQDGAVLGTPVYMPPEQAMGKIAAIDERSDIYSLGAILYELLTLVPPVDKEGGYLAVLMNVSEGKIMPPEERIKSSTQRKQVPPKELSAIAMKALAKEQKDRYPTAEAFRKDIERFLEGRSVSAKEDTFREAVWKLVKRNKQASFTACIAFLVVATILGLSFRAVLNAEALAQKNLASLQSEHDIKRERGKTSAPFFMQDAKASAASNRLEYALAQVSVALEYDPELSDARLLKGQLLIVTKDFAAARKELEWYVRQRPEDREAAQLVQLCKEARPKDSSSSAAFIEVFIRQKAFRLAEQMEQDRDKLLSLYRKRIEAAWPGGPSPGRLTMDKEGKCQLNLAGGDQFVKDLSPLQGMPLTSLNLAGCVQVWDLSPLQGMPLTWLSLRDCVQVRDLSALQGMKLTSLRLDGCQVRDLSPLKGMPLTSLNLYLCGQVRDLSPLQGMPLTSLSLHDCSQVRSLSPVRGMPLTSLNLRGCAPVRDLSPLEGMNLTEIWDLPPAVDKGMSVLRRMKSLGKIKTMPADEFWKQYDAGKFPQYKD